MSLVQRRCGTFAIMALLAGPALAQVSGAQDRRRSPVVEVFEQCRNAVVNISTTRIQRVQMLRHGSLLDDIFDFGRPYTREQAVRSVGSGVLIHEDGYIVTNAHVVAQASDINVIFADGRSVEARKTALDFDHDLAVLKIDSDGSLPFVKLVRPGDILVGETVVAIGNPLGLQHSVTTGIVSAVGREVHFGVGEDRVSYTNLIQTDAAINPGNSGGPLLNVNGELIGINSNMRVDAQNVGFAISVEQLWSLLPTMLDIERRQRVRFGLEVSGPLGEVTAVHPDSPAQRAGLRPGDQIVRFDGEPLRDGIDYYVHLLGEQAGDAAQLTYKRGDKTQTATVAIQAVPPPDGGKLALNLLGVELGEFDAATRRRYDLPDQVGVYVEKVSGGGPADNARVIPGDVILSVNRISVTTLPEVGLALEDVRAGADVLVEGLRLRADSPFAWTVRMRAGR